MINYRKLTAALIAGTITCFSVVGCSMPWDSASTDTQTTTVATTQTNSLSNSSVVNTSSVTTDETEGDISIELDEEDTTTSYNESEASKIELTQTSATVTGSGVTVDGSKVTITSAGTYVISGTLTDGCIDVNVSGKGTVRIILNGVNVTSSTTAPFIVEDAKKVVVTLADGTTNTFTDSTRATTDDEDYSAAITSKADLTFNGNGTLNVNAGYRNGIKSSDDLKIVSGTFNITSNEDGIVGKDLLAIKNGTFNITSGQDGMKSTYDTDDTKGNIIIDGGTFNITAATDGIQSEHILRINGGDFNIKTGGGYQASTKSSSQNNSFGRMNNTSTQSTSTDEASMKGLKAGTVIKITSGTYTINAQDDAVHTNGDMYIDGGTFNVNTGDDGFHADTLIVINDGNIKVENSYESIEAETIIINGGDIDVTASDDGINAAGGSSSNSTDNADNNQMGGNMPSGMSDGTAPEPPSDDNGQMGMGQPNGQSEATGERPELPSDSNGQQGNMPNGMGNGTAPELPSDNNGQSSDMSNNSQTGGMPQGNNSSSTATLTINGGNILVNASGDGLDANGSIYINGGTIIISGPTSDGDTAIDFDNTCEITGGTVMAFGSSGMLETPTSAENGSCIVTTFSTASANSEFSLKDSSGNTILSYTPSKTYASAIVYSTDIKSGSTYTVNAGSTSQSIEVSSSVTSNGVSSGFGGGGKMNNSNMQNGNNDMGSSDNRQPNGNQNGNMQSKGSNNANFQ